MKTKTKDSDDAILIRIADKLVLAQQELDELVLQFSLGKAEAKDKFEEIKNEFVGRVREFRRLTTGQRLQSIKVELRKRVDELEEILKNGVADSRETFEKQKEQIERTLAQLKRNVSNHLPDTIELEHFSHEIEKFKLKLEILRLAFALKKLEVKDSFRKRMHDVKEKIEHIALSAREKMNGKKSKVSEFRKEAREVYVHLKKAIDAL